MKLRKGSDDVANAPNDTGISGKKRHRFENMREPNQKVARPAPLFTETETEREKAGYWTSGLLCGVVGPSSS